MSEAITRTERYLAALNGETVTIPKPITRLDHYFYALCQNGTGGGGGGATDAQVAAAVAAYMAENPVEGGGGLPSFKLIRKVTIPEDITTDTSGINFAEHENGGILFGFDTDENGDPFAIKELIVYSYAASAGTTSGFQICITRSTPGTAAHGWCINPSNVIGTSGAFKYSTSHLFMLDDSYDFSWGVTFGGGYINNLQSSAKIHWHNRDSSSTTETITKMSVNQSANYEYGFTPGSEFYFFGR